METGERLGGETQEKDAEIAGEMGVVGSGMSWNVVKEGTEKQTVTAGFLSDLQWIFMVPRG